MDIPSGDIGALVFIRRISPHLPQMTIGGDMLMVLTEMDGTRTLDEISQKVGVDMEELREVVSSLSRNNLIQEVGSTGDMLSSEFMDMVTRELSKACGPIAGLLVEDAAEDMGVAVNQVPADRAAELIEMLAREIPREEKRVAFQQAMLKKVR